MLLVFIRNHDANVDKDNDDTNIQLSGQNSENNEQKKSEADTRG